MGEIAVGVRVRFRESSFLPKEWKLAADAIGTIVRIHLERGVLRRWVDVRRRY